MTLASSLLQALVRLKADALVIHVGETPYVVTPTGQVELASRALTLDAVQGTVAQLLSPESQGALDQFGAAHYELPPEAEFPGERFTVVAARDGDDLWVEIRRLRASEDDRVPADVWTAGLPTSEDEPDEAGDGDPSLALPSASELWPSAATVATGETVLAPQKPPLRLQPTPVPSRLVSETKAERRTASPASPVAPVAAAPASRAAAGPASAPAVVLPLARNPVRPDTPPLSGAIRWAGLERLLRIAAARGASRLYLCSQLRPSVRVDGEIQAIDSEPPLGPADVESLLAEVTPSHSREALRNGVGTEWTCTVAGIGRVRCMRFSDYRGAGAVFSLIPSRATSAEQLGLSREVQALAAEPEGLILIAGSRLSGHSTLVSAFVDLINRTRRDYVITIENEITVVHEHQASVVSQREAPGDEEMLAASRIALRENPNVLVLDELRTPQMVSLALSAASSGRLVIAALPASTVTGAVDRILDSYPPEQRHYEQLVLAENLRGIVAQVLLRKTGGGSVAAREVLLNTPAVAAVIASGKTSQLPLAIEAGRAGGMVPLNDALVGFVQSGIVGAAEAYRRAVDRPGFLTQLEGQGIDTSSIEQRA